MRLFSANDLSPEVWTYMYKSTKKKPKTQQQTNPTVEWLGEFSHNECTHTRSKNSTCPAPRLSLCILLMRFYRELLILIVCLQIGFFLCVHLILLCENGCSFIFFSFHFEFFPCLVLWIGTFVQCGMARRRPYLIPSLREKL